MKVRFESPFIFELDVLEVEDRFPSLYVDVNIFICQFKNKFQYDGIFWIECAVWSNFVEALISPSEDVVSLNDMNGYFSISICKVEEKFLLKWNFFKADIDDRRQMSAEFKSLIDGDDLAGIRKSFEEFPIWW